MENIALMEFDYHQRRHYEGSQVIMNPKYELGHHGNDFAKNLVTLQLTYDAYKAPRIAVNYRKNRKKDWSFMKK